MSSPSSSVDFNNAGCPCEPHGPSDSPTERAAMRRARVSGATEARDEHVTDRLLYGIPRGNHAQRIQAQVMAMSAILADGDAVCGTTNTTTTNTTANTIDTANVTARSTADTTTITTANTNTANNTRTANSGE